MQLNSEQPNHDKPALHVTCGYCCPCRHVYRCPAGGAESYAYSLLGASYAYEDHACRTR